MAQDGVDDYAAVGLVDSQGHDLQQWAATTLQWAATMLQWDVVGCRGVQWGRGNARWTLVMSGKQADYKVL